MSLYLHTYSWCADCGVLDNYCSADMEYIPVKCRIFLPCVFSFLIITAVYVPPDAYVDIAFEHHHCAISKHQKNYPELIT